MTAEEALAKLGTARQTLYANVSRGRIAAKPDPDDPRRSLYSTADILKLAARHAGRQKARTVAEEAIAWGEPVLASSLSSIARGRLLYRGQDAAGLALQEGLESVAGLLWQATGVAFQRRDAVKPPAAALGLAQAFAALGALAVASAPSRDRAASVLQNEGAGVVGTLAAALLGASDPGSGPVHQRIATAWDRPAAAEPIRIALVVLADHELNASTFAARIAISTGASLAAGVLAGLATLTGPLHGGASAGVAAIIARAEAVGARAAVREWLAQGLRIPAFGHPLYPDGDPRAVLLLSRITLPQAFADLRLEAESLIGEQPNIDFALAALAATQALPDDAPFTLFAIARSVGWIAHGLEQLATGQLIRPRARYIGPPPLE